MKSIKKGMKKMLLNNVKAPIGFKGRKVGTSFQIKNKTEMKQSHDIVYYNECPTVATLVKPEEGSVKVL